MANETQNSRNPASDGSMAGMLKEVLKKFLEGVDDMLPAVVVSYDRDTNRATVKPMIRVLKTDNTLMDRAEIADVPVLSLGGGSFVVSFPINPGDLGWIKASDRDISLFLKSMEISGPDTLRKHSFSDSIFIPDAFRDWTLNAGDVNRMIIQTTDGKHVIAIDPTTGISIRSLQVVQIVSPFLLTEGFWVHSGNLSATGFMQAAVVRSTAESPDIELGTHKHLAGTVPGDTGVPKP